MTHPLPALPWSYKQVWRSVMSGISHHSGGDLTCQINCTVMTMVASLEEPLLLLMILATRRMPPSMVRTTVTVLTSRLAISIVSRLPSGSSEKGESSEWLVMSKGVCSILTVTVTVTYPSDMSPSVSSELSLKFPSSPCRWEGEGEDNTTGTVTATN